MPGQLVTIKEVVSITRWWNTGTARSGDVVPSPNPGTVDNFLYAVTAISSSDIWAVGFYQIGGTHYTLVEHWNGAIWTSSPVPALAQSPMFYKE